MIEDAQPAVPLTTGAVSSLLPQNRPLVVLDLPATRGELGKLKLVRCLPPNVDRAVPIYSIRVRDVHVGFYGYAKGFGDHARFSGQTGFR